MLYQRRYNSRVLLPRLALRRTDADVTMLPYTRNLAVNAAEKGTKSSGMGRGDQRIFESVRAGT